MSNTCKEKQKAIAHGKTTYFTGKPCKRGHYSERLVSNSICIACSKEVYQVADRDNYRYKNTFYRQFVTRRQTANRNNIPFNISFDEIDKPEFCPVLGIKLDYGWSGEGKRANNKATIDKVIPSLGYVPGNVFVISWKANKLKSDMSLEDLEKIIKYVKEKINGIEGI